jgi:diguanylate cyclase (GGDEF)-like protein
MRRVLVFSFAIVAYIAFGFMKYDDRELIYNNNTIVLMMSLIHFLISTIIYTIFGNHNKLFKELESQIIKTNNTINQLNSAHTELKNSKAITDSMYELSQEVLKNEDFSKVLQMVLDKAVTLIPKSQAGSILVLEDGQMHYKAAKGYNLKNLQKIILDPSELYQATLDDMYSPYIIKNLKTFDEVQMGKDKSEKLWESAVKVAKSCMTCSFKYGEEFYGSINMDNFESEDIFNDKDMYMIKQLAHEIEILISIHMLYKKSIDSSRIDYLTGAFTRKYTMSQIEELIENDSSCFGVCIFDINDFKMVNDKFGHDAGDKCLTYFSNAIKEAKSKNSIFGRFGGDEFLLVVKDASREETIKEINSLKKWFDNNTFDCNKESKRISFAAGYAMFPEDGNSIMELIKIADINMYKDKKNRL